MNINLNKMSQFVNKEYILISRVLMHPYNILMEKRMAALIRLEHQHVNNTKQENSSKLFAGPTAWYPGI